MKIAIAGASGRMGRVLTRIIHEAEGLEIVGGLEPKGAPSVGADIGELAGVGPLGVAISDEPLPLFTRIEGLIDFTVPQATLALAELSAQARIVHVIGTTGIDKAGDDKIKAAARHARIVKSGNMSLGVNLLAALVRKIAASLDEDLVRPAEEARRSALAAFREGAIDILRVVDAERTNIEARREALDLTVEAFLATSRARLAAGLEVVP